MKTQIIEALQKWYVTKYTKSKKNITLAERDAERLEESLKSRKIHSIPLYDGETRVEALLKSISDHDTPTSIIEEECSNIGGSQKGKGELAFFLMIKDAQRTPGGDLAYKDSNDKLVIIELKNPEINVCVPSTGEFTDRFNQFHDLWGYFRNIGRRINQVRPSHPLAGILHPYSVVKIGEVRAGTKPKSTPVPRWEDVQNTLDAIQQYKSELESDPSCKVYFADLDAMQFNLAKWRRDIGKTYRKTLNHLIIRKDNGTLQNVGDELIARSLTQGNVKFGLV